MTVMVRDSFEFKKRGQLSVATDDKSLSVAADARLKASPSTADESSAESAASPSSGKKLNINALPDRETDQAQHRNRVKTDGRRDNRKASISVRVICVFLGNRTEVGARLRYIHAGASSGVEENSIAGDSPLCKGRIEPFFGTSARRSRRMR